MRRCNSWPLTASLERAFENETDGYGFAPDPDLPDFLRENKWGMEIRPPADPEMPPAVCGWCDSIDCNGIHLSFCYTWRNLSAELNLELPRKMHYRMNARHMGRLVNM